MEGMILAAGLGTRLRPLTDRIPKALVPVAGVPILERVAGRLIAAGVRHLIINLHHHADQIRTFVEARDRFGIEVSYSLEPDRPLDTGGGLKHAARQFRQRGDFFLHNVDVLSDVDLTELLDEHRRHHALASLAVQANDDADRYLLRSGENQLCGYGSGKSQRVLRSCTSGGSLQRVDFCGIQVLHSDIFERLSEEGVFSIVYSYARLAEAGASIRTYDVGNAWWTDIGTPASLEAAHAHITSRT